jgi:hypothetical protein
MMEVLTYMAALVLLASCCSTILSAGHFQVCKGCSLFIIAFSKCCQHHAYLLYASSHR